jgi:hypothetical protein
LLKFLTNKVVRIQIQIQRRPTKNRSTRSGSTKLAKINKCSFKERRGDTFPANKLAAKEETREILRTKLMI